MGAGRTYWVHVEGVGFRPRGERVQAWRAYRIWVRAKAVKGQLDCPSCAVTLKMATHRGLTRIRRRLRLRLRPIGLGPYTRLRFRFISPGGPIWVRVVGSRDQGWGDGSG